MTIAEIKALPDKFDFKSNINPLDIIYHAVKKDHCYEVTGDDCIWTYDEEDIHGHLMNDDYVIYDGSSVNQDKFIDQLNGILKDHFDYVSLDTTLKIAKELMNILPKINWIE